MSANPEAWSVYVSTIKSLTLTFERSRIVEAIAGDPLLNESLTGEAAARLVEIVENASSKS